MAQELSIASRAATPPKLAPYPTLVGTAMTGAVTSPPMTLGERAFHAGDDDDHARRGEPVALRQEPVQAGDADVVQPVHVVAHDLGRDGGFFCHRYVRSSRRSDQDYSLATRDRDAVVR